jgi:hypothetical protein
MSEYFSFKKFITTGFIMVIYILGAIAITIVSILLMLNSGTNLLGVSGIGVVIGLVLLIVGNLFWRVLCEYLVVQFRIFTELVEINKTLKGGPSAAPSAQVASNTRAESPVCSTCGGPLTYVQQYQRWYCEKERKYV